MDQAIIFDLDGTLWNSADRVCDIWNCVFDKYEDVHLRMTQEVIGTLMGKTMEDIGGILFPELPVERRRKIVDDFGTEEVKYLYDHGATIYDGLEEALKALSPHYDLYIVSNCQDGYVPAFLHAHKMEAYFKDIEMSGRTGMDKGHNIRLLMERNNIRRAVYVGDTEGDEKASRFAGIPFLWASYGFGTAAAPDAVINAITDLPDVVSKMDW